MKLFYDIPVSIMFKTSLTDCTQVFDIHAYENITLDEFVNKHVLRQKEWGSIELSGKKIEYRNDEITVAQPDLMSEIIAGGVANGGWGMMNYILEVKNG